MSNNPFVRSSDPETSQETGRKALEYSPKIQRYVADLMDDGVARIDEEICADLNAQGKPQTSDAFRHGRKALEMRNLLVPTGRTRPTIRGRELSTEWVKPSAITSISAALDPFLQVIAAEREAARKKNAAEKKAQKAADASKPQGELFVLPAPPTQASKHCATCTCGEEE